MSDICDVCSRAQHEARERAGNERVEAAKREVAEAARRRTLTVEPAMTTTRLELAGYRIVEEFGVVRGLTVRSRGALPSALGAIATNFGGEIGAFQTLCEESRGVAFKRLLNEAAILGANAVIGVRYESSEVVAGVTEMLAYGSAVTVQRLGAQESVG